MVELVVGRRLDTPRPVRHDTPAQHVHGVQAEISIGHNQLSRGLLEVDHREGVTLARAVGPQARDDDHGSPSHHPQDSTHQAATCHNDNCSHEPQGRPHPEYHEEELAEQLHGRCHQTGGANDDVSVAPSPGIHVNR